MEFAAHLWLAQAIVATVLTAPIAYFGRLRTSWRWWETLALVIPFSIWLLLMSYGHLPKSLSNVGEVGNIALAIPLVALVRVALARRFSQAIAAPILFGLLCFVPVATYFFTPLLPE
jgi:glycopeptide antibiotics resistance protein